jgi:hypothetical protein
MRKAYDSPLNVYVSGKTLYVAGTKTMADMRADLSLLRETGAALPRWHDAEFALAQFPYLDTAVGHSMGGNVALELFDQGRVATVRTYGTPLIQRGRAKPGEERYRDAFDPISLLDRNANTVAVRWPPHSFMGE